MAESPILVVLNDDDDALDAVRALRSLDREILQAKGVAAGLDLITRSRPGLVITDTKDGPGLGQRIQLFPEAVRPKCLIVCPASDEKEAIAAGAVALLPAPLDKTELLRAARELLDNEEPWTEIAEGLGHLRTGAASLAHVLFADVAASCEGTAAAAWGRYFASWAAREAGDGREAYEQLAALHREHPTFWRAAVRVAELYEKAGRLREAAGHYLLALRISPTQVDIQHRVAALKQREREAEAHSVATAFSTIAAAS